MILPFGSVTGTDFLVHFMKQYMVHIITYVTVDCRIYVFGLRQIAQVLEAKILIISSRFSQICSFYMYRNSLFTVQSHHNL